MPDGPTKTEDVQAALRAALNAFEGQPATAETRAAIERAVNDVFRRFPTVRVTAVGLLLAVLRARGVALDATNAAHLEACRQAACVLQEFALHEAAAGIAKLAEKMRAAKTPGAEIADRIAAAIETYPVDGETEAEYAKRSGTQPPA